MRNLTIIAAVAVLIATLAGCPPKPPDAGSQLPWGNASELRLTPLSPGKWFEPGVSSGSGRPTIVVVIDKKMHWCVADEIDFDCNPQASVGVIARSKDGKYAQLTYPDPRRSLVSLPPTQPATAGAER